MKIRPLFMLIILAAVVTLLWQMYLNARVTGMGDELSQPEATVVSGDMTAENAEIPSGDQE
jgi:hypothetical protein